MTPPPTGAPSNPEPDERPITVGPETGAEAPRAEVPAPPRPPMVIRNQTAYRLFVAARGDEGRTALRLPPWGQATVAPEACDALDLEPWTSRSLLYVEPEAKQPDLIVPVLSGAGLGLFAVGFYGVLVWSVWALFPGAAPGSKYWTVVLGLALAAAIVGPLYKLQRDGHLGKLMDLWLGGLSRAPAFLGVVGILLVAFGLPAVVMAMGEGCCPAPPTPTTTPSTTPSDLELALVSFGTWFGGWLASSPAAVAGRVLQLLLVGTLSALPALLYFVFDRRKLTGLRERFFRSVVQLDPDLRTLEDARSVHGDRADEVLGPGTAAEGVSRTQFTRQAVILIVTLIVTIGWVVALDPIGDPGADSPLYRYLLPQRDPFVFAFLGGYAFAVGMLFRRYVRSDLKPEAFAHVLVRIVMAVTIAWAATELPFMVATGGGAEPAAPGSPQGFLLVLAFLVGFFPETGLALIREYVKKQLGPSFPSLEEKLPLERLDGINLYHRTRLMDEGVDNLENLAHADVVDLMLGTRIPLDTLLDWIDQAILILHLGDSADGARDLERLRSHGIRTATDLERACHQAERRGDLGRLVEILPAGAGAGGPPRLQVLVDSLGDDQWMPQLRRCRGSRSDSNIVVPAMLRYWDLGEAAFLLHLGQWERERANTRTDLWMEVPAIEAG